MKDGRNEGRKEGRWITWGDPGLKIFPFPDGL